MRTDATLVLALVLVLVLALAVAATASPAHCHASWIPHGWWPFSSSATSVDDAPQTATTTTTTTTTGTKPRTPAHPALPFKHNKLEAVQRILTRLTAADSPTHACRRDMALALASAHNNNNNNEAGGACAKVENHYAWALIATKCTLEHTGRNATSPLPASCADNENKHTKQCVADMSSETFGLFSLLLTEAESLCRELNFEAWQESVEELLGAVHSAGVSSVDALAGIDARLHRTAHEWEAHRDKMVAESEAVARAVREAGAEQRRRDVRTLSRLAALHSTTESVHRGVSSAQRELQQHTRDLAAARDELVAVRRLFEGWAPALVELVDRARVADSWLPFRRAVRALAFYAVVALAWRVADAVGALVFLFSDVKDEERGMERMRAVRRAVGSFATSAVLSEVALALAVPSLHLDLVVTVSRVAHVLVGAGTVWLMFGWGSRESPEEAEDVDYPFEALQDLVQAVVALRLSGTSTTRPFTPSPRLLRMLMAPPPGYRLRDASVDADPLPPPPPPSVRSRSQQDLGDADEDSDDVEEDPLLGSFATAEGDDAAECLVALDVPV